MIIGKELPELSLEAYSRQEIVDVDLSKYREKTLVLVFYPLDFTFVCPTEILAFSRIRKQIEEEGAEIFLVSSDSVYAHKAWSEMEEGGIRENTIPLISDPTGNLSKCFGVYLEEEGRPLRATVILEKGAVVYQVVHRDNIGRSTTETLRVLRALNFSRENKNICPIDWDAAQNEKNQ